MSLNVTGGAAKSIQSINVAAVVAVVVAAAVAGLASSTATHYKKKLCVWRKAALFSHFFSFIGAAIFFPHVHARPELVQRQGPNNEKNIFFKKRHYFLLGVFW